MLRFKPIVNIIWLLLSLLLLSSLIRNIFRMIEANRQLEITEAEIKKMQEENEKITREVEEATSKEFIEKEAHDKLGLAYEDETVVVLPDADTLRSLYPKREEEKETLPDPNWKKWLKLFF